MVRARDVAVEPDPVVVVEPKPGWQTTEFWLTIAAQIIAALAAFGVVKSADVTGINANVSHGIQGVFGAVVSAVSLWAYIKSRQAAKTAVMAWVSPRTAPPVVAATQAPSADLSK